MFQKIKEQVSARPPVQKLVLLVLAVRLFAAQFITPYNILSDSESYVQFPFGDFFQLQFDGRTPVYPAIIRLCYVVFGEVHFYQAVVVLQQLASIIAVAVFYQLLRLLVKNPKICFWVAALYGVCPSVYGWDYCLLTESFALSGTMLFLYWMVRYIQKPSFKLGAVSVGFMLVLTFLRPTFLLFECLLFAFWIGRWIFCKEERRLALKLCLCSCVAFLCVGLYSVVFYQTFGYYSISDPMPRQSLMVNLDREYYLESTNQEFQEAVQIALEKHYWNNWYAASDLRMQYTDVEIMEITNEYIETHYFQYVADTFAVAGGMAEGKFPTYYAYNHNAPLIGLLPVYQMLETSVAFIQVGHIYLFIVIELVLVVYLWVKRKTPPWLHLGLSLFLAFIVASTFFATCDEYQRTMICVFPFAYTSFGLGVEWLHQKFTVTELEQLDAAD